jgi:3-oxoadipate enol-lactonase
VPEAANGNVSIAWHAHGPVERVRRPEPLLMIMGLAGSARAWTRLLPHVSRRHRALVFDNRGTGDSDGVRGPLTMDDLAADALAVLDAAGEDSAHVLGVSMGGMVAQHLALAHRERVRSLLLACTTPGGRSGSPPWRLLATAALRPVLGPDRTSGLLAPALYAPATRFEHPERIDFDRRVRLGDATPTATLLAQMAAVARHDVRGRLGELDGLSVTVIHGADDVLVPPARGRELAAGIPGARLVELERCGHMLTTDAEAPAAGAVLEHLARYARPSSRAA